MAWRGNPENKVPNVAQTSEVKSEARVEVNRAAEVRRDTDKQKNPTIRLIDIDGAIMKQIEKFQLQVTDNGSKIKVPLLYASPEKWKSIQKDGYIRDYQGKIQLPVIAFHRTTTDKNVDLMMFNRYLNYPVMKKYSVKNRYTPFNVLVGQNVPINEVYDVVMPDHVIITYHFIIWTEYQEQQNDLVERLNFEAEDYWGELRGFRFRTKIDSFSHTIELTDQDRIVKGEFDMQVYAYLLPDVIDKFQGPKSTTQKHFTPKKVVMGIETVTTNFNFDTVGASNNEKIRNQNYPNLPANVVIPAPPIVVSDIQSQEIQKVIQFLPIIIQNIQNNTFHLPPPLHSTDPGEEGWVSYDSDYYYLFTSGVWKRVPIALFDAFLSF